MIKKHITNSEVMTYKKSVSKVFTSDTPNIVIID